ncbi:MAG: hypothetical protein HC854_03055 [Flavobacterium sp.]|nr:hypothetical protein [Flavobacterium sp.]
MKIIKQIFYLLTVFLFIKSYGQVEVTNYGDIPLDRLAISRWQNFKWDGTGNWETIDVTTKGILPNKTNDVAPLINNLINSGSGKRILKFPAGTFNIKTNIDISKGDLQIVGEGNATKFLLQGGTSPASISGGGKKGEFYNLSKDAKRGDNTISLTSSTGLNVGDYFIVTQPGSATRPGASGDETQIFKIVSKSGNILTLDMKFGIPFYKATSKSQKLTFKKNLRFHNFYIEMTTKPNNGGKVTNFSLNTVQNVEISNVESNKASTGHITIFRGREVIVHDCKVHGNYGGGGGTQGGIIFNFSTNCHIINNEAWDLRHHYATQFGCNHCVIAYNRALAPYNDYADYGQHNSKGCHNNLFEGNYGREIFDDPNPLKSWGTRYTMWYRNHATSKIGSENEYVEYMNIIANELKTNASGIKKGAPGKFTFAGANIVSINGEGGTGTMVLGDLNAQSNLPASLFLKDRPSYVVRWPLYGPKVTNNTSPNNPPVVSFTLPTTTTFTAPATLIFKVNATDNDQGDNIANVKLYKMVH